MTDKREQNALQYLERKRTEATDSVSDFKKSISTGKEVEALSWGDDAFKAAAEIRVTTELLDSLKKYNNLQRCINALTDMLLHKAQYPTNSTSPCSNFMEQQLQRVRAEVLEELSQINNEIIL